MLLAEIKYRPGAGALVHQLVKVGQPGMTSNCAPSTRKVAEEYFERFPKDRYQTEVESWRNLQSANIEFTMKRLREPIEDRSQ